MLGPAGGGAIAERPGDTVPFLLAAAVCVGALLSIRAAPARRRPPRPLGARTAGGRLGKVSGPMLLYDSAVSGNCYKVRLLLAQLGLEFERQEVDVVHRRGRMELLGELNPALRVPTLVLEDGRPLAESARSSTTSPRAPPTCPRTATCGRRCCSGCSSSSTRTSHTSPSSASGSPFSAAPPPEAEIEARRRRRLRARSTRWSATSRAAASWSASATRSPTSRSTPTPTSPTRAASSSRDIRRSAPGSSASPPSRATIADHRLSGRRPTADRGPALGTVLGPRHRAQPAGAPRRSAASRASSATRRSRAASSGPRGSSASRRRVRRWRPRAAGRG